MEKEIILVDNDKDWYDTIVKQGVPKEILLKPEKGRLVKAGNIKYDMDRMTPSDIYYCIERYQDTADGLQFVINNYENLKERTPEQEKFLQKVKTAKANMLDAKEKFEQERQRRKLNERN